MSRISAATIALISVCAGYLIAPMGMAAVNVAIPQLALDLNASADKVGWLPTIYLLSNVAFLLPFGKLSDNIGRKKVYVGGLALSAIAALMGGLSQSIDMLLVWRFVQGMSGAMIFGTGVAIITSVVPKKSRGSALGIVAACVYIGLTMAPAAGGWLTEWLGWRSVFLFQVPLIAVLLLFMGLYLKGEWKSPEKQRFDWNGSAIFIVFATSLVVGLSLLPSFLGWIISAVALVMLLGFIKHQSRHSEPLIRVQMFRENKMFSFSLMTSFFMYGSNFAVLFLMSLYLQYVRDYSPSETGQILLLQALMMAIIAPIAGRLADKFEPRILATLGTVIVGVGFAILSQLDLETSQLYLSSGLLLVGLGFGLFSTPNNNAILGAVDQRDVGVASASMNLGRTTGNLVGMSLVNLMMHYFIGDVPLSREQNPAIMQTISMAFYLSLSFVIAATVASMFRGRVVRHS